jgi:hypothetical protein
VKSLEGLYLTSFDATKIRINKKVQEFYQGLKSQIIESQIPVAALVEDIPIAQVAQVAQVIPESNVFNLTEYEYKSDE